MDVEWIDGRRLARAAVAAFVVGGQATRLLHDRDDGWAIPLGLFVLAAIPVVWDFATSGLEVGIAWLWLAVCWLLLVRAAKSPETTRRARAIGSRRWSSGSGRSCGPTSVSCRCASSRGGSCSSRGGVGRVIADVAVAFAIPIAYQVFRMGYFAVDRAVDRAGQGRRRAAPPPGRALRRRPHEHLLALDPARVPGGRHRAQCDARRDSASRSSRRR